MTLHVIRKIEGAFQEYHDGRDFLEKYIQHRNRPVSLYYHSLRHFELTALLAYHAYDTVMTMISKKLFKKDDGSPMQRLNKLQNISKHE
jgi:hypothetical protein